MSNLEVIGKQKAYGNNQEILSEIEKKILEIEKRIEAGKMILRQCRGQISVLKKKLKEFQQLEYKVSHLAADGDL